VREAIFDVLESLGGVAGARVVDLFAGSGALGIEALSRGAAHAVFVDHERTALATVRTNLAGTEMGADRAQVANADALRWLASARSADVVLCDPPYDWDRWDAILPGILAMLTSSRGLAVLESGKELDLGGDWQVLTVKRYGGSVVTVARPAAKGGM
jgi:16S rRNA (guanine966-N2)-methyltransferase